MPSFIDRLKHTRIKGGDTIVKGAKKFGEKVSNIPDDIKVAGEEKRIKKESKILADYKAQKDRRRMAEVRVYGRELTEKERREYDAHKKQAAKEKQDRVSRLVGQFHEAKPDLAGRRKVIRTSRGRRVVYVQEPIRPSGLDMLIGAGAPVKQGEIKAQPPDLTFGGLLGTGVSTPIKKRYGGGGSKKSDPLNPGGLLF